MYVPSSVAWLPTPDHLPALSRTLSTSFQRIKITQTKQDNSSRLKGWFEKLKTLFGKKVCTKRALPPILANSIILSCFFTPQSYQYRNFPLLLIRNSRSTNEPRNIKSLLSSLAGRPRAHDKYSRDASPRWSTVPNAAGPRLAGACRIPEPKRKFLAQPFRVGPRPVGQYSSASRIVRTRLVTARLAGSGEPHSSFVS